MNSNLKKSLISSSGYPQAKWSEGGGGGGISQQQHATLHCRQINAIAAMLPHTYVLGTGFSYST